MIRGFDNAETERLFATGKSRRLPSSILRRAVMWLTQLDAAAAGHPDLGERKKGGLAQPWVHKFRSNRPLYLPGYARDDAVRQVYLETLGRMRTSTGT